MNEQISALIDDEIAVHDAAHLITSVQSNKQANEAWSHYHLIGDAMRGSTIFSPEFKHNLMRKLDTEATVLSPNAALAADKIVNSRPTLRNQIPTSWSIAASCAAVMVVGWMAINQQTQTGNELAPVEVAQTIPAEYLMAHQSSVPTASTYYIQSVNYSE
jgi:sigma-E factor negative regulatory protein RseA